MEKEQLILEIEVITELAINSVLGRRYNPLNRETKQLVQGLIDRKKLKIVKNIIEREEIK